MKTAETLRKIEIAGPCAAQDRGQMLLSANEAKRAGVEIVRMPLFKPRTRAGSFEGLMEAGIPLFIEVANKVGITPATEVLVVKQAEALLNSFLVQSKQDLVLWLGARNYNSQVQKDMGSLIKGEKRVMLGIKNPMWRDMEAWIGAFEYVRVGGAEDSQLFGIHRGFAPGTDGFRNTPDFALSMAVKREANISMVLDPSHIGGTKENVCKVIKKSWEAKEDGVIFDGMMVEVHPKEFAARTDASQQLTWEEYGLIQKGCIPVFDRWDAA